MLPDAVKIFGNFQKSTCIFYMPVLIYTGALKSVYAPIAQLDRVTDYESVGRGFESLSAYQKNRYPIRDSGFSFLPENFLEKLKKVLAFLFYLCYYM